MWTDVHGGRVTLEAQVAALTAMSTAELAAEYARVVGRLERALVRVRTRTTRVDRHP